VVILLAEDDLVTRATLAAILTAQGHEVMEVEDGSQAWGVWQLSAPRWWWRTG
jgi:CheY-like chemotaxis protein